MNSEAGPSTTFWQRLVAYGMQSGRSAFQYGQNFLLPPHCLACGTDTNQHRLCAECRNQLTPPPENLCSKCAAPVGPYLDSANGCIHCRTDRFHFEDVIRFGVYRDALRQAVLQAKSTTGFVLASELADLLFAVRQPEFLPKRWDVVVPVAHLWTRAFTNQHLASETIAEQLANRLQLPCERRVLRKVKWTPKQAGVPPSVRRLQQKRSFAASARIKGLAVLLVDDVLTTGATADAAAEALKSQGARRVTVAVLARGLGEQG